MSDRELIKEAVKLQERGRKGEAMIKSHLEKKFDITLEDEKIREIKKEAALILDEREEEDEDEPSPKKKKVETKTEESHIKKKGNDEWFVVSSSNKGGEVRFTKSKFKGKINCQIREYYEKDNDLLPGKSGISINRAQWDVLMKNKDLIESWLDSSK